MYEATHGSGEMFETTNTSERIKRRKKENGRRPRAESQYLHFGVWTAWEEVNKEPVQLSCATGPRV